MILFTNQKDIKEGRGTKLGFSKSYNMFILYVINL